MKKYLPYISGIISSTIFGFSFLFTKNALISFNTFELLFFRFLIAFITMSILIILKIVKVDFRNKNIKTILLTAILQPVLYFIMETFGLLHTTSSQAGVMMAFIPVLVTILSIFILKEKPYSIQVVFIVLSVIGVMTTVIQPGSTGNSGEIKGIIFLFCAISSAALFNIFSRKASKTFTPFEITYFMMLLGTVVFGIIYFIQDHIVRHISILQKINVSSVSSILYLGILSSVVAFMLSNYYISKLPAYQSSVFANFTTVVSIIAGITIRHETFNIQKLLGAVMIIAGIWGANYFSRKNDISCRQSKQDLK